MAEEIKYQLVTDKGETINYSAGFTGKGVATYPNGDIYDGEFAEGVRQGKGKYTYGGGEQPDRYEGQFFANEKHGIGRMFYTGKGEYFGNFVNGKETERAYIYSGNWKNGKKHGQGTYVYYDTQSRYHGEFYEGNMISGKWKLSNGQTYEGDFKHNQPNGCWQFGNGNQVQGVYHQQIIPKVNETDKINIKLEWAQ